MLQAVDRLGDVPAFADRAAIAADLTARAKQQQGCLDDRDAGDTARAKLVSACVKLVVDGSQALAELKGALDERFPRQRDYVAAFFMDVAGPRGKAAKAGDDAAPDAKPVPANP